MGVAKHSDDFEGNVTEDEQLLGAENPQSASGCTAALKRSWFKKNKTPDDEKKKLIDTASEPKTDSRMFSKQWRREHCNATYLVICFIAALQGLQGLADLGMSYLYKDDLHMSPSQVSFANGFAMVPWIIKPLWGFISDCFPIFGYRRKPYLILFGLVGMGAWLLMSLWVNAIWQAVMMIFFTSLAMAFCNVIGEALVVERSQGSTQHGASGNVSLFFGVKSCGTILTAYLSGFLLEYMHKRNVFLITAFFPLVLCFISLTLTEKPNPVKVTVKNQMRELYTFVSHKRILRPIIFIFLFVATPSQGDAMFFFYTNELKFNPEFMGRLRMVQGVATLLGIIIYNRFLSKVAIRKVLLWSTLICVTIGSTQILLVTRKNVEMGIPDSWFTLGDGLIIQATAEIQTVPLLVLACRLCPPGVEGSLYALLMSTINLGSLVSNQLGGVVTLALGITSDNFKLLWVLVLISQMCMLLPLPLLFFVPTDDESPQGVHAAATADAPSVVVDGQRSPSYGTLQRPADAEIEEEPLLGARR
eukprot:GILJ01002299.1.p1 GENE.GILJ01002299.1~~GILJ01002299.1.p1  ORF type:complete len:531 (+),score=67.34 GILJ01002299.1:81-1673(+)